MPPVFAHGQLRLYLLALLEQRPMHGYEVITALSDRFGGTYRPSAGTIYPRLAQLEEDGLVRRTDVDRRSTYELTDAGAASWRSAAASSRPGAGHRRDGARPGRPGARRRARHDERPARRARRGRPGGPRAAPAHGGRTATPLDLARAVHRGRRPAAPLPRRGPAELRRADTAGRLEDLTVETLRTVLDSALSAVRQTVR
jgi:DNA-binding PadR family transcriptional regulator